MYFFFNDTATTEIYTLSLHDALPISGLGRVDEETYDRAVSTGQIEVRVLPDDVSIYNVEGEVRSRLGLVITLLADLLDRKSTRLNSSHANISYAVFCLKKKKTSDFYR